MVSETESYVMLDSFHHIHHFAHLLLFFFREKRILFVMEFNCAVKFQAFQVTVILLRDVRKLLNKTEVKVSVITVPISVIVQRQTRRKMLIIRILLLHTLQNLSFLI